MEFDPGLYLNVPEGFDDSDAEAQVHPIARRLFSARTAAEAFRDASEWVGEHNVKVIDVSWNFLWDEDLPNMLSVYFTFELEPEDDDQSGDA
ncbi:hypothetical protein GA0115240_144842 [Streptomyces sp. DvalAA-14]|uniref:hypothetical protein n=1 Tax=unclassified Streptomyces TaxID=2593676 RepID=UPI00081B7B2F|nr:MULTISPECIES: hypothetical protein [unclassified Streptomyces]MYS22790.1 hypothetical protein [Streptomyces sp. SID4948]SCE22483.1 hypothetical protein GA0115240_144842 [Streptomyces sp. DvalAA-14]